MKVKTTITVLVLTVSMVWAQEKQPESPVKPAGKTATSVLEQIGALTRAFDKRQVKFSEKVRAEKDQHKKMKLYYSAERPNPEPVINKVVAIAKQNPKAIGVENGLLWCIRRANRKEHLDEIKDLVLTHYKDSQAVARLAQAYFKLWNGGEEALREIIQKAGSEKTRQGARYYLATKLAKKPATKDEGVSMMKELTAIPSLKESNPRMFSRLKTQIKIAEELSVGCTAPDIVGTDHEGKEFKLSDYRNKVVLLDFWGYW